MARVSFFLLVSLLAAPLVFAQEESGDVEVLTDDNFSQFVQDNKFVFVKFYAPWCGHCKALAPDWEKLGTAMKDKVSIAKVDCTENPKVQEEQGVRGYPTLKLFVDGTPVEFEGDRSLDGLQKWVTKMTVAPTTKVANKEELESFRSENELCIIAFTANDDNVQFAENFARKNPSFEVAQADASLNGGNAELVVCKAHGEQPAISMDGVSDEDVAAWIDANAYPPVSEMSPTTWQRLQGKAQPVVVGVIDYDDETQKKDTVELLSEFADVGVSITYGPSAQLGRAVEQFGGSGKRFPTLIGLLTPACGEDEKFKDAAQQFAFDESKEWTKENVKAWLAEVAAGTVKPFKKSEPIPESNDGPVFTLVGDQYDEVLAKNEFTFIKYYAPWCGHCKSLAPIWEELGAHYKGNSRMTVAKYDATANYVDPKLGVQGFPTLLLHKKGADTPVRYEGDRTKDAFITWLDAQLAK